MEEILKMEEGKTLEFKENASSLTGIVKTVVAFANTAGGTIVVGVEDKTKKIVGLADPLEDEMRIINKISETVHPSVYPNIDIQSYRGKTLILIHVAYSAGPHYFTKESTKTAYIRFGSTNRAADENTLKNLMLISKNITFDEAICPGALEEDSDWDALNKAFRKVHKEVTSHKAQSLGICSPQNPERASNGGVLLFGKERSRFFPDAIIRCVRFLGLTRGEKTLDHTIIVAHLPKAVDDVVHFIAKNTKISSRIGKIKRIETPEYPPIAIREAVINAIVHADYSITGASIIVAIFDDRIEITNPGGVPYGLTLQEALAGSTRTRNRVITKTFHHLKIVEQWGSGLQKIITACTNNGLREPKFEETGSQFRITLYAISERKAYFEGWRKELVDELKKYGELQASDAAIMWDVNIRTARERLKRLIDEGVILKVRTSKTDPLGKYVLNGDI